MTDKQTTIDGIDVSGCECIIEDYQRANNFEGRYEHIKNVCELGERGAEYYNLFCKDNPNCYYKQLKRKEQECEKLKNQLERTKGLVTVGNKQLAEALKGYEELTSKCSQLEEENFELKEEVSIDRALFEEIDQLKAENEKLKQTLIEIREICNNTLCDYLQCSLNYNHSKDFECEKTSCNRAKRRKFILEILQKINKVEYDLV